MLTCRPCLLHGSARQVAKAVYSMHFKQIEVSILVHNHSSVTVKSTYKYSSRTWLSDAREAPLHGKLNNSRKTIREIKSLKNVPKSTKPRTSTPREIHRKSVQISATLYIVNPMIMFASAKHSATRPVQK